MMLNGIPRNQVSIESDLEITITDPACKWISYKVENILSPPADNNNYYYYFILSCSTFTFQFVPLLMTWSHVILIN